MQSGRPGTAILNDPRSERVRRIRRLSGRAARLKTGRFVAEGPQAVREAVVTRAVRELYATPDAAERYETIVDAAAAGGVPVQLVTPEVLAALADTVTPQGLLAVCPLVSVPLRDVVGSRPRLVAVLARVRDPGNAGTVIRAADAAGADAVILTEASVDVHNSKCVRSTAGSLFHLPVVTGADLAEAVAALRSAGLVIYAADGDGWLDLDDLLDAAARGLDGGLAGPTAWIFGNEAWGIPADEVVLADAAVRVPVHGSAESLNLATAATVCLYASARAQRRGAGCRVPPVSPPATPPP